MGRIQKADQILDHGYVITMDPQRNVYVDGAVVVIGEKIAAVGKREDILEKYQGRIHDCKGGVVHPGLIDAHEHLCHHVTRGWEPDTFTVLDTWTKFESLIYPALTEKDEHIGVEFSTLEMVRNGTTAFSDTGSAFFSMDNIIEPVNRVGIKGIISNFGGNTFPPELAFLAKEPEEILRVMEENLKRYGKNSGYRVRAGVQLCGMGDCSDPLVLGAKEIARRTDDVLYMHQCVSLDEMNLYRKLYGQTPIEHLDSLGVLDEKTTLVHMIHLTDEDIRRLAKTGTNVVHCPGASVKYGLGASSVGKFPEMAEAGITLALGTDSSTWSDALDIFQQIYLAATIHREARREQVPLHSYRAFEMATLGGAKAIGMADEIGSIEVGKSADLVIHTQDIPECCPAFDPFINLVYSSRSKSVRDVMVDGRWIVLDGHATQVDEERIMAQAREAAADLAKRTGYRIYTPWKLQ